MDNSKSFSLKKVAQTISLGISTDAADTASEIDITAKDATGSADTLKVKLENTQAATNSIIEGKLAKTGLITTEGFRDLLEIQRQIRPSLYDLLFEKPIS